MILNAPCGYMKGREKKSRFTLEILNDNMVSANKPICHPLKNSQLFFFPNRQQGGSKGPPQSPEELLTIG